MGLRTAFAEWLVGPAIAKASLANQAAAATNVTELANALARGDAPPSLGPGEPMTEAHPEEVSPRRWDYAAGYNLRTKPRQGEGLSFEALRLLCNSYDAARLAIEARKDEARGWDWDVRVKPVKGLTRDEQQARARTFDDQVAQVRGFLLSPNQEDDFGTWLVQYLDDLFQIDAPTLYLRPRRGGGLYGADVIDGATIKPLLDSWGRTPALEPTTATPAVHVHLWEADKEGVGRTCSVCHWPAAYAQVIKGVPWGYYAAYELVYTPYHQSATSPYGSPPMEWVQLTVNRALRRQTMDLSNFTDGTLPTSYYKVPEGWTPEQLRELQSLWDDLLSGDDKARSKVRFVPGGNGAGPERINPEPTTEVEKWLRDITFVAFGTSAYELGFEPTSGLGGAGFGEASRVSTDKRGSRPLAQHLKGMLDRIIAGPLGSPELEFRFRGIAAAQDALAEAQARMERWKAGAYGTDEWRDDDGLDPVGLGPTVFDPKLGVILVADVVNRAALAATPPPTVASPAGEAKAEDQPEPGSGTPPDESSANSGEETVGGQPVVAAKVATTDDLAKWSRKAQNAVRQGRDPSRFTSEAIDTDTQAALRARLATAKTPAQVRAAFATMEVPS